MDKQHLLESLKQKGFSTKIINAFSKIPREDFIPEKLKSQAYEDNALPISEGQTISQPYTIALMLKMLELKKGQKVLEAGSGSGYVLALISEIVGKKGKVLGIEIVKWLAKKLSKTLKDYKNIKVYNKNGAEGLDEESPFDRILISAAAEKIPEKLISQLKMNGILVAPVGSHGGEQSLVFLKKIKKGFVTEEIPGFVFVPFVKGK